MSSDIPPSRRRTEHRLTAGSAGISLLGFAVPTITVGYLLSATTNPTYFFDTFDTTGTILLVLAFVVVLALNFLFVAGDVAVEVLRSLHVRLHEDDPGASAKLQAFIDSKESVVAACVLGSATMRAWLVIMCSIPAAWIAHQSGLFSETTALWPTLASIFWVWVLLTIPVMGFNIAFAEIPAKSYASANPDKTLLRVGKALWLFNAIFLPFQWLVTTGAGVVTKRFGSDARFNVVSRAEEEIKEILGSSTENGEIQEDEREMLESVFEFGDTVAREVMTPRVDLESVPIDSDLYTVANLVEATGHSRFPVYEGTDDQIIGIVHAKDILRAIARGQQDEGLRPIIRPAHFVPESKKLHDLLGEMRASKAQLVIVQDEFGGTSGIVSIEDIVEELVGDIVDEYDQDVREIVPSGDGFLVMGRVHLDDLNDEIGTELDSEEFDTIGGYVFGLFGRQPKTGESISDSTHVFTVQSTDGRRIERLRVESLVPTSQQA